MKENKINKIIDILRNLNEDGGPTMSAGTGGFSSSANAKGPVAGFDTVMGMTKRKPSKYATGGVGSRRRWLDFLNLKSKSN